MGLVEQAIKENVFTPADVERICAAIRFAAEEHKSQTRKNEEKTPYICHPLEVTYDLMKIGQVRDVSVIIGAILHDTSLDKKAAIKELSQKFGAKVASLVKEVNSHPVSAQKAHQRDLMIHAADQSIGSAQIELADLLRSLKELSSTPPAHWNKERLDHYFQWAQSVLDRFPDANKPLHDAVKATILAYWAHQ
jgi:guanosine-3',5'-bis(diphosphate) 3'-pyrophosphohydrolase